MPDLERPVAGDLWLKSTAMVVLSQRGQNCD
jgi:hypothetical protein